MNFPLNVYIGAVAGSFLTSLLALRWWCKFCVRVGLVDDPGHRKIHDEPVPLAGGLSVLTGIVAPILAGAAALYLSPAGSRIINPLLVYGWQRRSAELAVIFLASAVITTIGCLDDKYELRPGPKFGGQFLAALLVAFAGVRITLFVPNVLFSYGITVLWILTVINAFNFMDNMNGLCAGLGAISAGVFALNAALDGQYLVALLGFLTCGALLGFLPHNFPKAKAFLGDTGSHLVGFLLAVMAILPHFYTRKHPRVWAVFIPLLVLAVPLLDLAWVVALRTRMGKPFYVGDTNHLSHRLVRKGWSKQNAVLLIWLMSAVAGGIALGLMRYL